INQPIVIALAADLGYQTQVETLIKSLCYHHSHLKIYLFQKTFPNEWFDIWCQKLALLSSEIIPVKVCVDFSKYKSLEHINETGFYRYLIPYLDEERVLYLDSDIVVDDNLSEMYWLNFNGIPLYAVEDYVHNHIPAYLDLDLSPYFNSGVLLINNILWKKYSVCDELVTINEKIVNLTYGDQDALNIYFKGGWGALPIEYNYQVDAILELVLRREQEELARKNGYLDVIPKIIHYTSKFKPWKKELHTMQISTRKKYWFYYHLEWNDILEQHQK
ncbi:TPA: glycosyltransferase family 8 protein, partial [Mannheimia haemolytica]|nr:glycosyltransferase family 8 protein [Mannheimia haemolytica]